MSKAVYIATIEPNSGKSIVVLGMMRMLLGKIAKVGYFRPIIDDPQEGEVDNHINTVISHFEIDINFKKHMPLPGSKSYKSIIKVIRRSY